MTADAGKGPGTPAPWAWDLLWLAVLFGALYFFALGRSPLDYKDEGRYAEIPREMIASGDWVTPRLDGVAYFEKPPLVYWLVAACEKAFGPGETPVRTTPVLFGIAGVLLAYAAARRLYGRGAGLASAVVLGTSALYFALAHILLLDLPVAVLLSATLFSFLIGAAEPPGAVRRGLFYALYASAALATLVKGLIGVLLPGAVMLIWLVFLGQWKRLRPMYLPTGLLVFFAIAAPWHLLVAARNPTWAHFYFVHEQWERYLTTAGHERVGPWWEFIPIVLLGLFPWVGFLGGALRTSLAGGWAARRDHAAGWFLALWAAFIFLFFSASQSKLIPYILPVFPPLAVLIGAHLARLAKAGPPPPLRWGVGVFAAVGILLSAAALAAVLFPGRFRIDPAQAEALRPYAWAVAAVLCAGAAAGLLSSARSGRAFGVMAGTAVLFLAIVALARPDLQKPGTKALALIVRSQARPGDAVYTYHEFFHDFLYYSGRTVDTVAFKGELEPENDPSPAAQNRFLSEAEFRKAWAGPGRAYAIARKKDVTELFGDPGFHYRLLGETRDHYLFTNLP